MVLSTKIGRGVSKDEGVVAKSFHCKTFLLFRLLIPGSQAAAKVVLLPGRPTHDLSHVINGFMIAWLATISDMRHDGIWQQAHICVQLEMAANLILMIRRPGVLKETQGHAFFVVSYCGSCW